MSPRPALPSMLWLIQKWCRCSLSLPVVVWDGLATMSQHYYRRTDNSSYRDRIPLRIVRSESELSVQEKVYLNAVEKGDYATVKLALEEAEIYFKININCIDPLGRTALLIAIENENLEITELLLSFNVYVGDALLHAIRKEVVGAVELLLNHKKPSGEKQVWWGVTKNLGDVRDITVFIWSLFPMTVWRQSSYDRGGEVCQDITIEFQSVSFIFLYEERRLEERCVSGATKKWKEASMWDIYVWKKRDCRAMCLNSGDWPVALSDLLCLSLNSQLSHVPLSTEKPIPQMNYTNQLFQLPQDMQGHCSYIPSDHHFLHLTHVYQSIINRALRSFPVTKPAFCILDVLRLTSINTSDGTVYVWRRCMMDSQKLEGWFSVDKTLSGSLVN